MYAPGHAYRWVRARRLYERYILPSSELQVNIPAGASQHVAEGLSTGEPPLVSLFCEPQREVFKLVRSGSCL